jgi:hypothetical protein
MNTIVAIDPGVSGGIALREIDGAISLHPMPESLTGLVDFLRSSKVSQSAVYVEEVPKFTGRNIPSSTTAVLFRNVGHIEAAAVALGYSLHRVAPKVWQEHLGLGGKKSCASSGEWKRKLKAKAEELYPMLTPTLKTADALLIMHWAIGGGR